MSQIIFISSRKGELCWSVLILRHDHSKFLSECELCSFTVCYPRSYLACPPLSLYLSCHASDVTGVFRACFGVVIVWLLHACLPKLMHPNP